VLVCCFFLCVVLHELGHSLVAQAYGVAVREIVLLPIGGVARLSREPEHPWHELLIALAGPLVNVAIAALLLGVALATFGSPWLLEGGLTQGLTPTWGSLLGNLLIGNIILAVFNMIPALPMDGGRVFRATLAMFMGKPRATSIAGTLGQVLAAGLTVIGLFKDPVLMIIGVFVFLGASQERASSQAGELLSDIRAQDAVNPSSVVLAPGDVLGQVLRIILGTAQSHFAVVHGEQVLGVLGREDVLRALPKHGTATYVAALMQRGLPEVDATMMLSEVRQRMLENEGRPVLVRGPDGYLGVLSFEDVSRVVRVAARLEKSKILRPADRSRYGAPL
jgi:Zn-dependent protease/predicted transcriptional regulator